MIGSADIILCVPSSPYHERTEFYLYPIIHPHIRRMVYVYKLTITFNKATCIIMPLILGYDRRIHGFCIFGYFT